LINGPVETGHIASATLRQIQSILKQRTTRLCRPTGQTLLVMNESIRLAGEDGACSAGSDVNSSANTGPVARGHLRLKACRPGPWCCSRNWQISPSAATALSD